MNILALTCAELTEAFKQRYGKGAYHAAALYRQVFRSGSTDPGGAEAFARAPDLARRVHADISLPDCSIISSRDSGPFRVVGLPGDGIGPEVYESATRVLAVLGDVHGLKIELVEQLIGGAAVDATGDPLPETTIEACKSADAVLLGAVGGPKWDHHPAEQRPHW